MSLKGGSFSIDSGFADDFSNRIKGAQDRINKLLVQRVTAATAIVYGIAHAKRPMITKIMMKQQGRTTRVSDPGAEAGVPVASGTLQLSITKNVKSSGGKVTGTVTAGENVPYANFIEFGTSKMPARPFMRPALNLSREAIKAIFNKPNDA
jgi:HK97 gp10 family phage protein